MNRTNLMDELETICQPYIISDSKVYEIVKQGDEKEYIDYLKTSITGIIQERQVKYKNIMDEDMYAKYISRLNSYILNSENDLKLRREVFKDIADRLLIGGLA